mmetsp:Transcript_151696/g.265073  ORF Transcript_151696/g.265073 Transcript_151696/m.265073 type:complete len:227 (-) Transcript_151696:98-778(-)
MQRNSDALSSVSLRQPNPKPRLVAHPVGEPNLDPNSHSDNPEPLPNLFTVPNQQWLRNAECGQSVPDLDAHVQPLPLPHLLPQPAVRHVHPVRYLRDADRQPLLVAPGLGDAHALGPQQVPQPDSYTLSVPHLHAVPEPWVPHTLPKPSVILRLAHAKLLSDPRSHPHTERLPVMDAIAVSVAIPESPDRQRVPVVHLVRQSSDQHVIPFGVAFRQRVAHAHEHPY